MEILSNHLIHLIEYAQCKQIKTQQIERPKENSYIKMSDYFAYYRQLFLASGDPYFGLHFGSFLNLRVLDSVYEVSLAAINIDQVIHFWKDYAKNNFPSLLFTTSKTEDGYVLEFDLKTEYKEIKDQVLDTFFTFTVRELKLMIDIEQVDIALPYHQPDEFAQWYNRPILKKSKHSFIFKNKFQDIEINTNRKTEIEIVLPKFLRMLSNGKTEYQPFALSVRNMVLNMCNPEIPNLHRVASQFLMTERTLQRRLKNEGKTFRDITNEIKRELYFYLKKGKKIKMKDISYLLGYTDTSSLLHAVQKWKSIH